MGKKEGEKSPSEIFANLHEKVKCKKKASTPEIKQNLKNLTISKN
jgi:hypothetical protein